VTAPIDYDRVVRLSPLVSRITERNPGRFTGPGTNTHLVGQSSVFLLDPGEDLADGHLEQVAAAVGGRPVTAIIPSHGHPDHWPLAPRLAERFQAPIWFFGSHPGFRTDRSLRDGETITSGGATLEVRHTPGHATDHLAFRLVEEGALFPGDLVMGWSTSIIAPPDGDLRQYLSSLERLAAVPGLQVAYPAHGPAIAAPYDRIRELYDHRLERTRQALEALAAGPNRIGPLVERIYRDTDPALHPAAARSLLAHLFALEAEGKVERADPAESPLTWQDIVWRIPRETA
jgi:glyoxylase-like metal-dependent hydrolase (beta-lactamase superfamily II)